MKNKIKNIIFDFGGVVFAIDEHRTLAAFAQIYNCSIQEIWQKIVGNNLMQRFECGEFTPQEFFQILQADAPQGTTNEQLLAAWNAILVGYPSEHIPLLLALKKKYRTFLLSNTNALHVEEFPRIAARQNLPIHSNHDMFEKVWYSNEIGMRKPAKEIFEFALRDANLNPAETIFVDDLPENVAAAQSVGIHAQQITPERGILQIFADWV